MSSSAPSSTPTSTPSSTRANLEVAAIGLGALMAALSQTLIIPVLPDISRDISASASEAQWLLTSTLLVAAVAVPVIGRLADMFGRRRMLLVALGALFAGSLIDALTSDPEVMIFGRALCGLSGAAIPLGISLLAAVLPEERKGSAVALVSAMLGVGGALGLPLAGLIADNLDYHVLYWIGAVGGGLSLLAVRALVAEPPVGHRGSIDVPGIVLLAGALVCLVLPLSEASSWGWGSAGTLGLLVVSLVLFFVLHAVETRVDDPLVDMRTLANPPIAITNVASVFIGFALFASFVGTSTFVQAPASTGYGFDASVLTAGLCLLPSGVLMLGLAPLAAKLNASWGGGRVLVLAGTVLAAGLVVRIVATDALWQVIVGNAIIGAGTGMGYATLPSLINAHSPAADLAAANGINSLARSLGSTLASAIGGSLLTAITITIGGQQIASLEAYRVLFGICAVAALLAAAAGAVIASGRFAARDAVAPDDGRRLVEPRAA